MKKYQRKRGGSAKTAFKLAVIAAGLIRAGQIGYGLYKGYKSIRKK
jgi:hypothetical protein